MPSFTPPMERRDSSQGITVDRRNGGAEVGSMSVGRYRHGVVPVRSGSCGAALFVAGGYVRSVPEGEETNVKSSSVELVLL